MTSGIPPAELRSASSRGPSRSWRLRSLDEREQTLARAESALGKERQFWSQQRAVLELDVRPDNLALEPADHGFLGFNVFLAGNRPFFAHLACSPMFFLGHAVRRFGAVELLARQGPRAEQPRVAI